MTEGKKSNWRKILSSCWSHCHRNDGFPVPFACSAFSSAASSSQPRHSSIGSGHFSKRGIAFPRENVSHLSTRLSSTRLADHNDHGHTSYSRELSIGEYPSSVSFMMSSRHLHVSRTSVPFGVLRKRRHLRISDFTLPTVLRELKAD